MFLTDAYLHTDLNIINNIVDNSDSKFLVENGEPREDTCKASDVLEANLPTVREDVVQKRDQLKKRGETVNNE